MKCFKNIKIRYYLHKKIHFKLKIMAPYDNTLVYNFNQY